MFLLPFHVVGCSHETSAAVAVGRMRLSPEQRLAHLDALHALGVPAVLLSTCHRTELYWWGDDDLAAWFAASVLLPADSPLTIERYDADLAVRHLFAVAAGMRSARFGEPEILGQVRQAWRAAHAHGATAAPLDAVFRHAIDAARHIRSAIGDDAQATLGARVRALIESTGRADGNAALRLLVIGSGDAARDVLESLMKRRTPSSAAPLAIACASRTDAHAVALAEQHGATPVLWTERQTAICAADVIVFAAHTTTPLVTTETARAIADIRSAPALWIDLGVPPNVAVTDLPPSINLRPLDAVVDDGASGREVSDARSRRAMSALQHELSRFAAATQRRRLGAQLAALEARAMSAARDVLAAAPVSAEDGVHEPADRLARQVTRVLLRELSALT